jgi:hypothetical protein
MASTGGSLESSFQAQSDKCVVVVGCRPDAAEGDVEASRGQRAVWCDALDELPGAWVDPRNCAVAGTNPDAPGRGDDISVSTRDEVGIDGTDSEIGAEEFLAPTPAGEDTFVGCEGCDYAANTEAVHIAGPSAQDPTRHSPSVVLDTPDTPTIESLVTRMKDLGYPVSAAATLKNVVLKTRAPGSPTWELLIVGVPGDRGVDLKRLAGSLIRSRLRRLTLWNLRPSRRW